MTRFQLAPAGETAIDGNSTEEPMDIGKPQRIVRVEPLEEPVPRETPAPAPEREPEQVPAAPNRDECSTALPTSRADPRLAGLGGRARRPRCAAAAQRRPETLWPTGEALVAECCQRRVLAKLLRRRQHGPVPTPSCRCGVYATGLAELEPLLAEAPWETGARVLGRVSLWGEVIECERGWRASHAYPAQQRPRPRRPRLTQEEIALGLTDYGVPVDLLPCRPSRAVTLLARRTVKRPRRSSAA